MNNGKGSESIVSNSSMDISICILFHEKADQTIKCIKSFLPSGVPIYILNNASSASSRDVLGKYCEKYSQITIFDSERNLGVAVGRNFLIENTKEKWLLFVDNDIYVKTKDWLERIDKHMKANKDTEVFIPKLFNYHDNSYANFRSMRIEGQNVFHDVGIAEDSTNTFPGGASFVHRGLFERLGQYDEKMFIGFEDFEYAIRGIKGEPVRGKLIHDIELVHEHIYLSNKVDKEAAIKRYDYDIQKASYDRVFEKHNLYISGNWENWVKQQVEYVSQRKNPLKEVVWKRWTPETVKKPIRKVKKKIKSK